MFLPSVRLSQGSAKPLGQFALSPAAMHQLLNGDRNIEEHAFEFIDRRTHVMLQNRFRMMEGKNLVALLRIL